MAVEVRPTNLSIESSLDDLADIFSMSLVEQDTTAKVTPKAEKWDDINKGTEVVVRFGLAGGEMLNFGTFIVDNVGVAGDAQRLTQTLSGRDEASKFVDAREAEYWGPTTGGNQGSFTWANPWASQIAIDIAFMAGLELSWNAPDWRWREFTVGPHETLSQALDRLLAPMRELKRYHLDAWVRDGVLFVRQRGNGQSKATVDIRKCVSWAVKREYIPPIGDVTCYGSRYRVPTGAELDSRRAWGTEDGSETEVEEEWLGDEDGLKVTTEKKVWTKEGLDVEDGERILVAIITTERVYKQVTPGGGGTAGKLLVSVSTMTQHNLNKTAAEQSETLVVQKFGYKQSGDEWFRVLEQTVNHLRKGEEQDLVPKSKKIVAESQVTPTEIERTTINIKIDDDGEEVAAKNQPPLVEQEPGVLQSVLRVEASPAEEDEWGFDVGGESEIYRMAYEEKQYEGTADGDEDGELQSFNIGDVGEDAFCVIVAGLYVADHDVWRYDVTMRFANEVRYQKGDKLTLSNIAGFTGTLDAVITDVVVELDGESNEYMYELSLQGWVTA